MSNTFFSRRAGMILLVVAFMVPFAVRGARLSVEHMKNDVKNWLPDGFRETQELDWFRHQFIGEQFVLLSWEGCSDGDERLALMTAKLLPEGNPGQPHANPEGIAAGDNADAAPPGEGNAAGVAADDASSKAKAINADLRATAKRIGEQRGLYLGKGQLHENWGGLGEKWLVGDDKSWYFITPAGELFEWQGDSTAFGAIQRLFTGKGMDTAKQITKLDPSFHAEPRRLTAPLFKSVTTGPMVLEQLTRSGGVLEDDPDHAVQRLTGTLFGPDGKQTCIIATLTEQGKKNLHRVLGRGMMGKPRGRLFEIAEECGIAEDNLHLGGPPVDNVAIDEEGTITLVRLVGLCIVLGVGLSYACFRSVKGMIMVFFVGGLSAVASLSFVYWFGGSVDAVMMSMPALIYVLGISGAVHIINYYREAVDHDGPNGAPEKAIKEAWKPAVLCSLTTSFGLLSLYTSEILPIRKFGLYSAIGVMFTLVLLFLFLPAALQYWPLKPRKGTRARQEDEPPWLDRYLARFWDRLGSWIIRHHAFVGVASVIVVAAVGWGISRMQTTVQLIKMFDGSAKIIKDYQWLEASVGRLVPIELVVRVNEAQQRPVAVDAEEGEEQSDEIPSIDTQVQLTFLERMEIVDRVQKVVEREFGERGSDVVGRTMSAATFAPPLPKARGDFRTLATRGGTNGRLQAHRDEFLHSDYLRIDPADNSELWRVSVRLGAFKDKDYGQFVGELKSAVEPVMLAYSERERILRTLSEANGGKGFAGQRVLLLGVPFAPAKRGDDAEAKTAKATAKADNAQADTAKPQLAAAGVAGNAAADPVNDAIAQAEFAENALHRHSQTFASTLADVLRVARLKLDMHSAESSDLPKDWDKRVASYDAVVVVGNNSAYDLKQIQGSAKKFIDVRKHQYDPSVVIPHDRQELPAVATVYTGVVPVVYKAQRTLLESLIASTFWSFVTITPLMMFVSRSFLAGIVAMLPNVAPVFIIFGAMGWLGFEVDIGAMMTASIALGVAVDDTIHFLTWYRRSLDSGVPRNSSILAAYRHCATPTFQTAMISGLGLSIFAFSTFTPTQRFGYLMLAILACGMISELILFPAILAGPLGRVFKPSKQPPQETPPSSTPGPHQAQRDTARERRASQRVDQPTTAPASAPPQWLRFVGRFFGFSGPK